MRSASRVHNGIPGRASRASRASGANEGHYGGQGVQRRAVGYVRVSTDMQAAEGMSLDAQRSAIESYCAMMGIKLVKLCQDVMSGGKDVRPGLADALRTLQGSADALRNWLRFGNRCGSIRRWNGLWWEYSWCSRRWNGRRPESARRKRFITSGRAATTSGGCPMESGRFPRRTILG